MKRCLLAVLLTFALAGVATAGRYFAEITAADPGKGTVTYTVTFGKDRGTQVKARLAKGCVIKEGYYRLGKPAVTKEGDDVPDGLSNPVFKRATAERPLRVNIYTADADDEGQGVRRGDVVKILVNPQRKKK